MINLIVLLLMNILMYKWKRKIPRRRHKTLQMKIGKYCVRNWNELNYKDLWSPMYKEKLKKKTKKSSSSPQEKNNEETKKSNTIFSCKRKHALNGNYFIKSILLTENARQNKKQFRIMYNFQTLLIKLIIRMKEKIDRRWKRHSHWSYILQTIYIPHTDI